MDPARAEPARRSGLGSERGPSRPRRPGQSRAHRPGKTPREMRADTAGKRAGMNLQPRQDKHENHHGNSPEMAVSGRVISYNVPEGERPGGITIRFKIRIATGKRAAEIDALQAKVIMEVLQWQRQHKPRP